MNNVVSFRVGIDVGLGGVGLAAIAVDPDGVPIKILNALVVTHDSGVDPGKRKTGMSRLASAGVARRVRRLVRRRRKRLDALDGVLRSMGYPILDTAGQNDPYVAWRVRAELAKKKVDDPKLKKAKISIAVRHMARHRGWRNPYTTVSSLHVAEPDSQQMTEFRDRVAKAIGCAELEPGLTPAEVAVRYALNPTVKLRGEGGILEGKLLQSDNANELRKIAVVQELPEDQLKSLINAVFRAESPKGAAAKRAGFDPLPGQCSLHRAPKAHSAFQRFRIVATLANMRIRESGTASDRRLTSSERHAALSYLLNIKMSDDPTWADVAERLNIERHQLTGAAVAGLDGDRPTARPPVDETDRRIRASKLQSLITWWEGAGRASRDAMVMQLAFGGSATDSTPEGADAEAALLAMSEQDLAKLDLIRLPAGRAAYSVDSLERLTARMLESEDDLYDARVNLFAVSPAWTPPAEPIGAPVGNPSVDRVAKIVARWLQAVERTWGSPQSVNIEHVREGFSSDITAREIERENDRRYLDNQKVLGEIRERLGVQSPLRKADVWRYQSISRQNGECAYCGNTINYFSAEMDHIVPRAGVGSTNTRENLLAVCSRCNRSKSNRLFYDWASSCGIPGVSVEQVIERTRHWQTLRGSNQREHRRFISEVKARLLRRTEDPEIDGRSMESVAWMANEMRQRIEQHFRTMGGETTVAVYRGQLTAEARKASGLEGRIQLVGGPGKSRLDRRHHAMDAATIAMMEPSVSRTLAERVSLRMAQQFGASPETWKSYRGATVGSQQSFARWLDHMNQMTELLNRSLGEDRVPVLHPLRLRLENSAVHDETIRRLVKLEVGSAMSVELIDRASTPALWCALTRQPDFDPQDGLPAKKDRSIAVHGKALSASDKINFFGSASAAITVRGGYVDIGSTIHHARIYRVQGKRRSEFYMVRVFGVDLKNHKDADVFSVPLPPHSISMRQAPIKVRIAVDRGEAEYLGWLVVGDEIRIDMSAFSSSRIGEFTSEYPGTASWRVNGFESERVLRLRPTLLASEGLRDDASSAAREIVEIRGWRASISKLWADGNPVVIRRDALGRPRLSSDAHLPVTWRVDHS